MGALPDLMFVIDTNKEAIAIAEARKLNMPVVAVVDSNSNPEGISHPIPGNDDAGRAITLYCDLISRAALDGIERAQGSAGIDLGAAEEPLSEPALGEGEAEGGEGAERPAPDSERKPRRRPGGPRREATARPSRSPAASPKGAEPEAAHAKPELVEDNG